MLENEIEKLTQELSQIDMVEFNKYVFKFDTPPHMKFVTEDALMDESKRRIIVVLPFKHAKSPIISVVYPSWKLGRNPALHFILVSNANANATAFSKSVREIIHLNENYKKVFPNVELDIRRGWGEQGWYLKREIGSDVNPTFRAAGYTGTIIGKGCDELIFDDLNDPSNTSSNYMCEQVNNWAETAARSRRLHEDSREIVVSTRWHNLDWVSELSKIENKFWIYHMPALSYENKELSRNVYCNRRNPKGDWERFLIHTNGPALWPERWSSEYLKQQEVVLGAAKFSLMYQGVLIGGEEGWVTEENFNYISQLEEEYAIRVQSWDTGLGKKTNNKLRGRSFSAMVEIGITKDGYIDLLDVVRDKMNAPKLNETIYKKWENSKSNRVGIENAAAGASSIEILKKEHPEVPIVSNEPLGSKSARASALEVYYKNGQIRHYTKIKQLKDYERDLISFMNSDTSDVVDAMAHAINMVQRYIRPAKKQFIAIDDSPVREVRRKGIALIF